MHISPRKITFSIVLIALGVALSLFIFPVGPTRLFPFQHMINAIAGIFLGPWYAVLIAFFIGVIRNIIHTGSLFAFPGGIPGALVVGCVYYFIRKTDYAVLTEPIGTAFGALLSALIVAAGFLPPIPPFWGIEAQWILFLIAFLISSIPGSILGFVVVRVLRRTRFAEIIPLKEVPEKESSNSR